MHARPVWFRAAIWVEVLVQAPFYAVAIYAFVRQRSWVRVPAIVYATVLLTIMPIVLAEQYFGPHASRRPLLVTAVYGAYVLMPVLLLVRVWSVDVFPSTPLAKRKEIAASRRQQIDAGASHPSLLAPRYQVALVRRSGGPRLRLRNISSPARCEFGRPVTPISSR